jgi:hypothetical protein
MPGPDESNLAGQCWSCSNKLSGRFCRNCGADHACTVCGAVAPKSFCGFCGTNLSELRPPQDEPQSIPILPPLDIASGVGEASGDSQDSYASDDTEQLEELEVDQTQEIDEPVDDALDQTASPESVIATEADIESESPRFSRNRKRVAGVLAFSFALLAIGISLAISSTGSGRKQQVAEVSQIELIEEPASTAASPVETTSTTIDISFLNSLPASTTQPARSTAPQDGANLQVPSTCNAEAMARNPSVHGIGGVVLESVVKISENPEKWLQISSLNTGTELRRARYIFSCFGQEVQYMPAADVEIIPLPTTTTLA